MPTEHFSQDATAKWIRCRYVCSGPLCGQRVNPVKMRLKDWEKNFQSFLPSFQKSFPLWDFHCWIEAAQWSSSSLYCSTYVTIQTNPWIPNDTKTRRIDLSLPVTLPGALLAPASSTSSSLTTRRSSANSSSSMQTSYRLPHPLPPLPVRKGVRGRRPKSQTIALLKAAAEAAAAAAAVNGVSQQSEAPMAPRPHKKRGPKPKNKVRGHRLCKPSGRGRLMHFYIEF